MQLSRRARAPGAKKRGFVTTGVEIVKRETPLGLYKGLGAVVTGIVPKMAIRFTSFEAYKKLLADKETGNVTGRATFMGKFLLFNHPSDLPPVPRKRSLAHTIHADKMKNSWPGSRCHRGSRRCNAHGGDQNPSASATPQHGRSA